MSEAAERVMAAVARADRPGALDLAMRALAAGDRHPLVLMLAAERIEEAGDAARAATLLRESAAGAPDEAEPWRRLGVLLARQGRHAEARAALERADALLPHQPAILSALGGTCLSMGALDAAGHYYGQLAAALPGAAGPLAALAAVAVRRGDLDAARTLGARALAIEPGNLAAAQALARAELDAGDAAQAAKRVDALLATLAPDDEAVIGLTGLRADAHHALGRYEEAFADYVARNALLYRRMAPLIAQTGGERQVDRARRIARRLAPTTAPAARGRRDPGEPRAHLFVLGFPRSGTTLLEKALAGHDAIRTLPEIDCLSEATGDLLGPPGLQRLAALGDAEAAAMRARYFAAATREAGDLAGRVLVDKLPLHSVALPAIARLFPDATLILSLRDPRDVVLSCLRRRFLMNAAMFELLRPADAVNYYEAVMTLVARARATLPITLHEVRHEQLVADLEGELRRVLALVGLDWQSAIGDFAGRAAANARTPSDLQLARGLNDEGVGTWRRYAAPLAPLLPRLAPWVTRFGYPA